jgi:hypothetical protein
MKRLFIFLAFLITGSLLLAACGGGSSSSSGGGSTTTSSGGSGGAVVTPGASGIKDPALLGKWISADGANGYEFKDDFTVISTLVGATTTSGYNIVSGGQGSGKVQIAENNQVVTWDYQITADKIAFTTPDGRSRKMTKTS